jgi:iron complex outermembrane receptor protein
MLQLRTHQLWQVILLSVLSLWAPVPLSAQTATGTISGRVVFEDSGEAVHGATVVIVGGRRTATTDDKGQFVIADIAAGTYDVIAQRGSLTSTRQSAVVTAGQTTVLSFTLAVGVREDITVTASATGAATAFESFNAITTMDNGDIARRMGATIADVLQDEPGIAKRTFGPGTSRPIIRGFDGDRVLIMQDGVRTGDLSSQSGDHGVSIDPASLERIEVVKGPATLLYGSNAIGGVVNAITPQDAFRTSAFSGTVASISTDAGTANAQGGVSGNVQHGRGPWLVHGSLTARRTGDYDAPNETVINSDTKLFTGEGGLGWTGARAFVSVAAGAERNRYGVPFAGLLEGDEDAQVDLDVRRENVRIDGGARNLPGRFAETVRLTASFLNYRHDELEIEDGVESQGTRFDNQVSTIRAELEQKPGSRLSGRLGGEFLTRDYQAIGEEALAPATRQQTAAAFVYEELAVGRQRLQFGGRVEHTRYVAAADEGDITRTFTGVSGSAGVHAQLNRATAFVANLTAASRAPALEELFNRGPHAGNRVFEIGTDDLRLERTLGLDVSLRTRGPRAHAELNVFTYGISNFVYLDVTDVVEDGLRVALYGQGDSRFSGVEATAQFDVTRSLSLTSQAGYVRAALTSSNEALPRIPPVHGRVAADLRAGALTITPEVVLSGRQGRVFRDEDPTAAWTTFNLGANWQHGSSHASHLVAVQAYNLTNEEYRLHTSFIKDLAPEVGRGVKVTYTVKFF